MVANIIMAQVVAKFFINMSFSSIYVYSSELFPTVIRYPFNAVLEHSVRSLFPHFN